MTDSAVTGLLIAALSWFWSLTFIGFKRLWEKNQNKAAVEERYLMEVSFMQMWTCCSKAAFLPERHKDPEAAAGEKRLFRPFFLLVLEAPKITVGQLQRGLVLDLPVLVICGGDQGGSVCRD